MINFCTVFLLDNATTEQISEEESDTLVDFEAG